METRQGVELRPDPDELRLFWQAMVRPGDVHEVRITDPKQGNSLHLYGTVAGYFDDEAAFVAAVSRVTGRDADTVYATLNPVNPDLLSRATNRLKNKAKQLTSDKDVIRRSRLLIDLDPVRPAGISATDEERDAALARRDDVRACLTFQGWPDPVAVTMSGNGTGLLYALDLPNDDETAALIRDALAGLAALFTDAVVSVDTSVGNAARITKIVGTVAAKGDHTERRPWRVATAHYPAQAGIVTVNDLAAVAAYAPTPEPKTRQTEYNGGERGWTVDQLLTLNSLSATKKPAYGGTVYQLDRCLTSTEHTDGAALVEFATGALAYRCHHNSCAGKDWRYLRAHDLIQLPQTGPSVTFNANGHAGDKEAPMSRPAAPAWPDAPNPAVYHGIAGEIVHALDPITEADPVAVLLSLLAAAGCIVGPGPHWEVSGKQHGLRVWPILVGATAKGRKGTAWGTLKPILRVAAPEWLDRAVTQGLSSGEGLIWAVRDPIIKSEPIKQQGRITGYEEVMIDQGIDDKRLFVVEEEFASTLRIMARDGNSLSGVVRRAWDDGDLSTMTKNTPARATGAHIVIVGHTTQDELLRYLDNTEAANGFANRFVWGCVRRSKLLPNGGRLDPEHVQALGAKLRAALTVASRIELIERDHEATALWEAVYGPLSDGGVGLLGAILSRAEAQVMRFAALYAVLDGSELIHAVHLRAAVALWDYLTASAGYIFGDALGDPVADTILSALRRAGELDRTAISDLFGRNSSKARLDRALGTLLAAGKARCTTEKGTGGRPRELWRVV